MEKLNFIGTVLGMIDIFVGLYLDKKYNWAGKFIMFIGAFVLGVVFGQLN